MREIQVTERLNTSACCGVRAATFPHGVEEVSLPVVSATSPSVGPAPSAIACGLLKGLTPL